MYSLCLRLLTELFHDIQTHQKAGQQIYLNEHALVDDDVLIS